MHTNYNTYGRPKDRVLDDIQKGSVVEYIDARTETLPSGRKVTVKVKLIGNWDGEKVQFTDKEQTLVKTIEWLRLLKRKEIMGHRQEMTREQRIKWDGMQYQAKLDANKGHNYEYWNDDKHGKLLNEGWELFSFPVKSIISETEATVSEHTAIEALDKLRTEGNFARIIAGYSKNVQRMKMFSIIFKPKKK